MSNLPGSDAARVEHLLMPGFVMEVLATRDCEPSPSRPLPHLAFKVIDPEGAEDWLCGYDLRTVGR